MAPNYVIVQVTGSGGLGPNEEIFVVAELDAEDEGILQYKLMHHEQPVSWKRAKAGLIALKREENPVGPSKLPYLWAPDSAR